MSLLSSMLKRHSNTDCYSSKCGSNVKIEVKKQGININDSNGVTPFVTKEDSKKQTSRLKGVVDGGLVHATHLCKICPRQVALLRRAGVSDIDTVDRVDSNIRLIWATGRAFEDHIRTQLIQTFNKNAVVGSYQCKCGSNKEDHHFNGKVVTEDTHAIEGVCEYCDTSIDRYVELPIRLKEYHSIYSPDFGYFNSKNQGVVIEMKSIKKENFEKLKKPDIEHVRQALTYNRAATLDGASMAAYVIILYASKGWINPREGSPYKEYRVEIKDHQGIYNKIPNTMHTGKIIGAIDKAGGVEKEYDSGDGFPEGVCNSLSCTTAKNCQMSAMCFMLRGE